MSDNLIRKVLVLGGGTAGWMAASYLGKALGSTVRITVLEAPAIPRIGVGEATIPNLQRVFFDHLGLTEEEWMPECNASYKMGIRFINWRTPGAGTAAPRPYGRYGDQFDHLFGLLPTHDDLPLSHYWTYRKLHGLTDEPFDRACYPQPALFDRKLSPRFLDGRRVASYAWHFDADLVAGFLRRFATAKQGVTHIEDKFVAAETDQRGHLVAVTTEAGRRLEADLFIDCSGFRSLLINQVMKEPFLDMSDHLLNDRAVATRVEHDDEHGVEPFTSSIAMSSGWSWKIPMLGRFGTGYVYSSWFTSEEEATREFCRMCLGVEIGDHRQVIGRLPRGGASVSGVAGERGRHWPGGENEVDAARAPGVGVSPAVFPVADRGLPRRVQVGRRVDHVTAAQEGLGRLPVRELLSADRSGLDLEFEIVVVLVAVRLVVVVPAPAAAVVHFGSGDGVEITDAEAGLDSSGLTEKPFQSQRLPGTGIRAERIPVIGSDEDRFSCSDVETAGRAAVSEVGCAVRAVAVGDQGDRVGVPPQSRVPGPMPVGRHGDAVRTPAGGTSGSAQAAFLGEVPDEAGCLIVPVIPRDGAFVHAHFLDSEDVRADFLDRRDPGAPPGAAACGCGEFVRVQVGDTHTRHLLA
ncbi:tryptophan halogenase family protein [Streptomyces sp. PT12]|uniref:tryptophan halogenase family protein n=1 Tax=Streptomyces sp. PT12 TaxID=1510197 RepID=UPI000DE2AB5C|nr:tryptophan halogenase family protein [Streptomyces sp. PT12]RBM17331.1 hypothetical protein DEH69_15365 [Streptomyces sp. PT12]